MSAATTGVPTASASSEVSRFATYRQRKRAGTATRKRRTATELAALEGKLLEQRTEEEKEAVRNHRKASKRKERATATAAAAHVVASATAAAAASAPPLSALAAPPPDGEAPLAMDATPPSSAVLGGQNLTAASTLVSAPDELLLTELAAAARGAATWPHETAPSLCLRLPQEQAATAVRPAPAPAPASRRATSAAAACADLLPIVRDPLPPNSLVACARRFTAAAPRGTFGKPYRLHRDQQAALLRAVELRVAEDMTSAAALQPLPSQATDVPRLSSSDQTLVRSILGNILTWPSYFTQLYAMLPRPRVRQSGAAPQSAIQEQLEVYEYIRDTGLRSNRRIGTDALDPDDRGAVRNSLRIGSDMEEAAFTGILRTLILRSSGLPIVHVPPQLLCTWAILAEQENSKSADAAMQDWCEEHREALLNATYVAFHWGQGHYCSLVLHLGVWRDGPPTMEAATATSSPLAPAPSVNSTTSLRRPFKLRTAWRVSSRYHPPH